MKVLFLSDNFPPEANAPAIRTFEHIKVWQRLGAEVTVITCAPNFPRGIVYDGYKNKLYQRCEEQGVDVIRVWSYISANAGFAKRILDYVSYAFAATLAASRLEFDVVVATSPQLFTAVAGRAAAKLKGRPWVMEVRDLWPESIRAVGAARGPSRLMDLLERLELSLYRSAAKVIVVTDSFRENLTSRSIDPSKIAVVTNGVDRGAYAPSPKSAALVQRLGLGGKTVVGYLGTHGLAHGLTFILSCAAEADPNVHFVLIGDGAMKETLLAQREALGLTNVTMLPPVPKQDIGEYLSVVDIALVPLRRSDTFKSVIPSKIFESAASGTPILLGVEGESKRIVERFGAGLAFIPEDRESFLTQLHRLSSDADTYRACQAACVRLAAAYDRSALATQMYEVVIAATETKKS